MKNILRITSVLLISTVVSADYYKVLDTTVPDKLLEDCTETQRDDFYACQRELTSTMESDRPDSSCTQVRSYWSGMETCFRGVSSCILSRAVDEAVDDDDEYEPRRDEDVNEGRDSDVMDSGSRILEDGVSTTTGGGEGEDSDDYISVDPDTGVISDDSIKGETVDWVGDKLVSLCGGSLIRRNITFSEITATPTYQPTFNSGRRRERRRLGDTGTGGDSGGGEGEHPPEYYGYSVGGSAGEYNITGAEDGTIIAPEDCTIDCSVFATLFTLDNDDSKSGASSIVVVYTLLTTTTLMIMSSMFLMY